ncbi:hypothetical protein C8J57DRAFT_1268269 [Mycena rebaudengoi]|nr:hypothetical protein C8J57DRAFT_1268269 [Mycena rebaudengoi]
MDELLNHCLRELAFDGDLGCNVSRLRDFIVDFYARGPNPSAQNPDDAFCAFIWSIVVQQPTVIACTSEVWLAPQNSAVRKAKAKGEEMIKTPPPKLDIVPDAKNRSLAELQAQYGDELRLATDPDTTYAAVTGTHIRFPKMSPMVYTALQIITRGRDTGVSVVQLGQRSKYDQKTCFYLVRQLTELDLVVKVRQGGVGSHFCIHKYFFDRSASWKAIREEETRAAEAQDPTEDTSAQVHAEEGDLVDSKGLDFSPIDARHLSSLPLVKARVIKLLKASKNFMHVSNNMIIAIGFIRPTKTDRRFFASRLRELIEQRVIEMVLVPSSKPRKDSANVGVKCFRLVSTEVDQPVQEGIVVQPIEDEKDDGVSDGQTGLKMNLTIHKQILCLLEESGTAGMTLNELAAALCRFDKRTIELLLARAEKYPPPPHLSDLGIAGLMETSGRERRSRYYTVASYRSLVAQENLDKTTAGYTDIDLTQAGGFMPFKPEAFYSDEGALNKHRDRDGRVPAKPRERTNPILADGTVKKGRPRKHQKDGEGEAPRKRKRKVADDEAAGQEEPKKRPPAKKRRLDEPQEDSPSNPSAGDAGPSTLPLPKKRGRPPKDKAQAPKTAPKKGSTGNPEVVTDVEDTPPVVKKRGRPKKVNGPSDQGSSAPKKRGRVSDRKPVPRESGNSSDGIGNGEAHKSQSPSSKRLRLESPTRQDVPTTPPTPAVSLPPVATLDIGFSGSLSPITPSDMNALSPNELSSNPASPVEEPNVVPEKFSIDTLLLSASLVSFDEGAIEGGARPSNAINPMMAEHATASHSMLFDTSNPTPGSEDAAEPNKNTPVAVLPITKQPKVNVSTLRRENELFRVVEILGGIVNLTTKDVLEAHRSLIIELAAAGEPTSAPPGTKLDRRTAIMSYNNMELRGRVKQMKATISAHNGITRPASLVYLPQVGDAAISTFLADLGRNIVHFPPYVPNAIVVEQDTEYGAKFKKYTRLKKESKPLPFELQSTGRKGQPHDAALAEKVFSHSEDTIREVLLTERNTIGQMYGFIVGKLMRVRELHLAHLDRFDSGVPSPGIISHEKRIATFSFFYHDIPLALYCAVMAVLDVSEELSRYLSTEAGRNISVQHLPPSLHSLLQIGRTRSRSRILDLLSILRVLKLAVPLEASVSDTPFITCAANGDHPTSFQEVTSSWTIETMTQAPPYWHFTSTAPIYCWVESETNPRFMRHMSTASCADAMQYWQILRAACTNKDINFDSSARGRDEDLAMAMKRAKTFRRRTSWTEGYVFSWYQAKYLKRFVNVPFGTTPLHADEGAGDRISHISYIVSAPEQAVRDFLATAYELRVNELEKAHRKLERELKGKTLDGETKALLAQKAAEAKTRREATWNSLVQEVYPGVLPDALGIRLRRVRTQFLASSGKDMSKWEREIKQTVREANMATANSKLTTWRGKPNAPVGGVGSAVDSVDPADSDEHRPHPPAPPVTANPPERSVASLIASQGPPIIEKVRTRRGAPVVQAPPVEKGPPRSRFLWTRDYEELAKDAFVIVNSRCRTRGKFDFTAMKQVFPGVNRNSVRSHLRAIRDIPTNAAYLSRLEDSWHEIWLQYRGTELLPDEDFLSLKFDLAAHIEFLRKHIDKTALRVGSAQVDQVEPTVLPASIEQLLEEFDVVETPAVNPTWEFMWSAIVDESREKRALRIPFTTRPDELVGTEYSSDDVAIAESALKMTMGTSQESYNAEDAARMLHCLGEERVIAAQKNLLSRGVLAKRFRKGPTQPGRALKISEINQSAIGGSVLRDTFQDAATLEDISVEQQQTWREWPLLATDGDTAALIQLVSDDQVDFKFDTSQAQLARAAVDWNSKKADDDHIETAIHVQFHDLSIQQTPIPVRPVALPPMEVETISEHGTTADGSPACCRRLNEETLVDCQACLEEEWAASVGAGEKDKCQLILNIVSAKGEKGIEEDELLVKTELPKDQLLGIVRNMAESAVPLVFWAGYTSLVLVASAHLRSWTVQICADPLTRIFPRRWFDIYGSKLIDLWEAGTRAVMGVLVFHPGVTQGQLRWRLRSVYDRQEVDELVRYLVDAGFIKIHETEHLFVGDRHWYQV